MQSVPENFHLLENKNDLPPEIDASPVDGAFSFDQVHQLAKGSIDFLAGLAIPDVYKYAFPDLYLKAWELITNLTHRTRDFSQVALGLPRGFAKTLVVKLLILYILLFTKKQFILVISENIEKAEAIISDVCDMLNEPNIIAAFGNWKDGVDSDRNQRKKFHFRGRDIIIKAAGTNGGIRGITEKNRRPDFMVFDDIQSREDSESEVLSKQLETWMTTTAMKAKSPEGCLFLFVANMYPTKGSLLRKLKKNPNWIKFIVGGILSNGTSLWEELQPIRQLLREYANDCAAGQPQAFFSEVLNDENASVNTHIDLSNIPPYPYDDSEINAGAFIIIDPASDKQGSDAVSVGAVVVHDGFPVLREVIEGRLSPGDTIRTAYRMAFRWNASLIVVESQAYQYSLLYWFEQISQQLGITGIEVIDIYAGQSSKNSRILKAFLSLVPSVTKEGYKGIADATAETHPPEILLHPEVRAAVFTQITGFNPLRRDNTDGLLDLITYIPRVIAEFAHMITYNAAIMIGELGDTQVVDETENSPF